MPKQPHTEAAHKDSDKREENEALDEELADTFPASDPPVLTRPGHGATGPEAAREKDKPVRKKAAT